MRRAKQIVNAGFEKAFQTHRSRNLLAEGPRFNPLARKQHDKAFEEAKKLADEEDAKKRAEKQAK